MRRPGRAESELGFAESVPDLPLIEVAERSGFKHQEYLGAISKAKTGTTPAQYRREARLT